MNRYTALFFLFSLNFLFSTAIPANLTESFSENQHVFSLETESFSSNYNLIEKHNFLLDSNVYDQHGNVIHTYDTLPRFFHAINENNMISLRLENDQYSGFIYHDSNFYSLEYDTEQGNYNVFSFYGEDEAMNLLNDTVFDSIDFEVGNDSTEALTSLKYVEVGVVSDKERYLSGSSSITTVTRSTESIINLSDSIYFSNNMNPPVRLVLKRNIVWTTDVILPIASPERAGSFDASDYLAKWYAYIAASPLGVDSSIIMSGKDFAGTLGIARVSAMCGTASGFMSKAVIGSFADLYSASIVVHEMGHSFSMRHDGSGNACVTGYIMWPSASRTNPKTLFSECSKLAYSTFFTNVYNPTVSRQCLENVPTNSTPTPTPTTTSTPTPTATNTPTPTTTSTPTPTATNTPTPTTTSTPTPTATNTPTPTTTSTPTPTTTSTPTPTTTSTPTPTTTSTPTPTTTTIPTPTTTTIPTPTTTSTPTPTNTPTPTLAPARNDGKCGAYVNNAACRSGNCCSEYGWCGRTSAYCAPGNCIYQCW